MKTNIAKKLLLRQNLELVVQHDCVKANDIMLATCIYAMDFTKT